MGWGFQLQSPVAVAALALIMLLVGAEPVGRVRGRDLAAGDGHGLAVEAGPGRQPSSPGCWRWSSPRPAPRPSWPRPWARPSPRAPVVSLPIFAALGLGLAAPFAALSFAPALLRRLPQARAPGWTTLRQVLAFPMYAAAAWLIWVLAPQTGADRPRQCCSPPGAGRSFAAWVWGCAQRGRHGLAARACSRWPVRGAIALIGLLAARGPAAPATGACATAEGLRRAPSLTSPGRPERVAALRAEGRPVFVNFTAAWCVTWPGQRADLPGRRRRWPRRCRAPTPVYLKGDWTNRDAAIAAALAEQGRAGVPLYLVYARAGASKDAAELLTKS